MTSVIQPREPDYGLKVGQEIEAIQLECKTLMQETSLLGDFLYVAAWETE